MFDTLRDIGEKLNEGGILWGLGASMLLNHYGFIDKPKDIDILVDVKNIEKADKILKSMGEKRLWEKSDNYSTEYFYEYVINGFEVDVMSGLRINHSEGIYKYIFDEKSISKTIQIHDIDIHLTSLEDWYFIYQLIPNREIKVNMIEDYLLLNGIKKPELLDRALTGDLPNEVRCNIKRLLNS
ncbi:hypothetical protein [Clostridium gasigenes]|uniref:Nucleotidyl transferase AbiEii toxin, Type IV TA system n=1 Tax=Clostridium gasigenes TaxID=94869 RepID=A0A7X0SC06_9CLOT|nr:hypothetical protein [Clostridium gasigenes]MBB6713422.1 hypothetical protein [Clostridium gasigenes]